MLKIGLVSFLANLVLGFCFSEQALAAAGWVTGKFSQAYDFDGDYYANVGDISSEVKTVAFWIQGTASGVVVYLNASSYISATSTTISTTGFTSPTIYVDGVAGSTIDSDWHYVVVTTDTGINATDVRLGSVVADSLDGALDDVKMYNYALSAREVAERYRQDSSSFAQGGTIDGNLYLVNNLCITGDGKISIGSITPTAYLTIKAGTATASTAPIKFTAGTVNTTPELGAMEWDGTDLFITV